jgi:hypothetical protein
MNRSRVMITALMLLVASSVSPQDQGHTSFVPDVITKVILDPTTYAPAVVAWTATRLDWQSSQIFFQHGSVEHNPRFTVSGRSDDTAISDEAGKRLILADAIGNLQRSLINNVSVRVLERLLKRRSPNHQKLLRTIGWIERTALASYWSYRLSARHFRQWQENEGRAQQLGYGSTDIGSKQEGRGFFVGFRTTVPAGSHPLLTRFRLRRS